MRHWERCLLVALALAVLALLARTSIEPAAFARADKAEEYPIAVCAMPSLVNELMGSPRYLPARENPAPELRERLDELLKELRDLEQRLANADPSDPDAQRDRARARTASAEFQSVQRRLAQAIEQKTAEQLAECYALVKSSAAAIADDLGYDYVIATGDPDEELSKVSSEVTLRQITARPVLRFPKGVDITDDVRDDLNLE